MLFARDFHDIVAAVDREQGQESREVAVERNVLEHIAPRGAHPTGNVVERSVREPAGGEMQREVLQPIHARVESRPPARHGEIGSAVHCGEELTNRGWLHLPIGWNGDDDASPRVRKSSAQQRRLADAARRFDRADGLTFLFQCEQRLEHLVEERMRDEDELVAPPARRQNGRILAIERAERLGSLHHGNDDRHLWGHVGAHEARARVLARRDLGHSCTPRAP